jgi:hypothetical protein
MPSPHSRPGRRDPATCLLRCRGRPRGQARPCMVGPPVDAAQPQLLQAAQEMREVLRSRIAWTVAQAGVRVGSPSLHNEHWYALGPRGRCHVRSAQGRDGRSPRAAWGESSGRRGLRPGRRSPGAVQAWSGSWPGPTITPTTDLCPRREHVRACVVGGRVGVDGLSQGRAAIRSHLGSSECHLPSKSWRGTSPHRWPRGPAQQMRRVHLTQLGAWVAAAAGTVALTRCRTGDGGTRSHRYAADHSGDERNRQPGPLRIGFSMRDCAAAVRRKRAVHRNRLRRPRPRVWACPLRPVRSRSRKRSWQCAVHSSRMRRGQWTGLPSGF